MQSAGHRIVRRLVTPVMWPQEDITNRLASPDIPSLLLRDTDLRRIVRRSGGTITLDGGPVTTAAWRRIRQWRHEWLALPSQVIPAVVGLDQVLRPGIEGLRYLAELADPEPLPLARAGSGPGRFARPAQTAQVGQADSHADAMMTACRGRLWAADGRRRSLNLYYYFDLK